MTWITQIIQGTMYVPMEFHPSVVENVELLKGDRCHDSPSFLSMYHASGGRKSCCQRTDVIPS
jgi:hypothetical protein